MAKAGIKIHLEEEPEIDRALLKEVAGEVSSTDRQRIKKTIKGQTCPN